MTPSKSIGKIFIFVHLVLILLMPAISCNSRHRSKDLVVLIEKRVETLDPRLSTDSAAERLRQLIFNGLTRKDEKFNAIPDLCQSIEQSIDSKSFMFHLRPGIRFHNGRPLSATDVKYTFDSLISREIVSGKKAELLANQVSVDLTTDPLTVIFHCGIPCPGLPNLIIPIGIIPEGTGKQQAMHPVGTGPFEFETIIEDQEIVLKSFKGYFEGPPSIDRVRIRIIPDEGARASELRKGSVDLAINADLSPSAVESLKQVDSLRVNYLRGTNITHLGLNLSDPILKNQAIRQAIAYSIDREKIIREILRGQAETAKSILPPTQWAFDSKINPYTYDPSRAKKLIDEARVNGQNNDGIKLTLKTSTLPISRKIAEALQEQLKLTNIHLEIIPVERQKLTQDMVDGNFQIYLNQIVGGNQSTDIFRYLYHTKSIPPNGQNRSRFTNIQLDKLLDEAQTTSNEIRKGETFAKIQELLAIELPQIYLWYPTTILISNKRVENVQLDPSGDWRVIRNFRLNN